MALTNLSIQKIGFLSYLKERDNAEKRKKKVRKLIVWIREIVTRIKKKERKNNERKENK